MTSNAQPPKKERREIAREHARLMREEEKKRKRRKRIATQAGVSVAILAALTAVALVIVGTATPPSAGPANMLSDGILFTGNGTTMTATKTAALKANAKPVATPASSSSTAVVHIVEYVDYQCPYCQQFETTNATQISDWVTQGAATVEIHPISLLDASSSGTKYSTRAANAAACVANYDPNNFYAFSTSLYKNQPPEGGTGLTDAKLTSLAKAAGATSSKIPACITGQTFKNWVAAESTRALNQPLPNSSLPKVTGTPTVLVNGVQYTGSLTDATAFLQFVSTQATSGSSTSTPGPTPTPTP
jgi:protein-disulfide isomerase